MSATYKGALSALIWAWGIWTSTESEVTTCYYSQPPCGWWLCCQPWAWEWHAPFRLGLSKCSQDLPVCFPPICAGKCIVVGPVAIRWRGLDLQTAQQFIWSGLSQHSFSCGRHELGMVTGNRISGDGEAMPPFLKGHYCADERPKQEP